MGASQCFRCIDCGHCQELEFKVSQAKQFYSQKYQGTNCPKCQLSGFYMSGYSHSDPQLKNLKDKIKQHVMKEKVDILLCKPDKTLEIYSPN